MQRCGFPFRAVAAACRFASLATHGPSSFVRFVLFSKGKHHHGNKKKSGWTAFPHDNSAFVYDGAALKKNWARLHKGDAEPFPRQSGGRSVASLSRR